MDEPEKREIQEELKMVYKIDRFIDGNPYIEERIEQRAAQREECFPALADQAQPQVEQIQDANALETLFQHLLTATTEREVRQILHIQENQ